MKYRTIVIAVLLMIFGVYSGYTKNLQAMFSHARFYSIKDGPFVETYLSASGRSVNYVKNEKGLFQAAIVINIKVKDASGKTVYSDGYNLLSPAISDSSQTSFVFIDQQRIPLPNGVYTLEFTVSDKNGNGKAFTTSDVVNVDFNPQLIGVSDVVMLDSYKKSISDNKLSKSGYDLVPYVDNFFPKTNNSLKFYAEVYNTSEVLGNGSPYLLNYYIENYESRQMLDNYSVSKKQVAEDVSVILSEFDISNLASGNYKLVVELRDRNNQLLSFNETFFQRSNLEATVSQSKIENINVNNTFVSKITGRDVLIDNVASLRPICNANESMWQENQLNLADTKLMQQFFYDFWYRRNPTDPEKAWNDYNTEVAKVQKEYGSKFLKGYNTDRGRVYLQYGPPNTLDRNEHEPDAYPYEIWQYYKIKNQSNRKFVFYNPDLVTNDYRLLHSDMNGEINNPNWNMELYKRNSQSNNMDVLKREQFFGNQSQEKFDSPK